MKTRALMAVVIAALCLVACKTKGGKSENVSVPADSLETEMLCIHLDTLITGPYAFEIDLGLEYIVDERIPIEVRERLNKGIVRETFSDEYVDKLPFDEAIEAEANDIIDQFTEEIAELFDPEEDPYFGTDEDGQAYSSYHLSGEIGYETPVGFISYTITGDEYSYGAAHGYYYIGVLLFDLTDGRCLHESDLFVEGYEAKLTELLGKYVENFEYYEEGFLMVDEIVPNGNFAVDEEGITYFFNPYEITAYAYGIVDITIPWEEIEPLLKPEIDARFFETVEK